MKVKLILVLAVLILTLMMPFTAPAAENDPRDAVAAPGGTDIFLFYYRNYNGNEFYQDDNRLDSNMDFDFNMAIARYAKFWSLADLGMDQWILSADILQPFGSINCDLFGAETRASGLGDTTLATHLNTPYFIETGNMKYGMSAGLILTAPTGEYHKEKETVNLGANRWSYEAEFTPVIWHMGDMIFELTGSVTFYSDNDDYGVASERLETDPTYLLQSHLSYDVTDSFWVGASYYYKTGGENDLENVCLNDEADNQKLRFTGAFMLSPQTQLLLQYEKSVEVKNGIEQDYIGARFAYLF
ncbi:MAG: transporter [Desulfobacteraceae bacterium]|nr:transporter [Desulfobacteraceae bacterium]